MGKLLNESLVCFQSSVLITSHAVFRPSVKISAVNVCTDLIRGDIIVASCFEVCQPSLSIPACHKQVYMLNTHVDFVLLTGNMKHVDF